MALLQISILGNLPATNDFVSLAKMMVGSAYSFFSFWNGPELQATNSLILGGGFAHPFVQFSYQVAARGATCHCKEAQFVGPRQGRRLAVLKIQVSNEKRGPVVV